ncbi:signal peptidase II [Candidatus Pelagibacter sp.]|uniref:signal peptidase II n=1 Tax=Candidatus Pelagibacter sp. TaxID=2024849 RepID=UPI003F8422F7
MIEKILRKSLIINLLLVFLIFVIDRVSKIYVIYLDKKFLGSEIYSSKFLNISLIWNEGVAFGLFAFDDNFFYNLITGFIILVILTLLYFITKTRGFEKYSFLIILGGACGNVFDRFFYSAVPDFIDIHYQNFHWFIFNVADIFITLGVVLLIYIELFIKNKKN